MTRKIRCQRCKRMYEYDSQIAPACCPDCSVIEEREYQVVRAYVKENRGVTLNEVSRVLKVPHSKVIQYLREERLEIVKLSQSFLRCVNCGRPILTGIRCDTCKKRYGA